MAERYEFYFQVAKQYSTNENSEWLKYFFWHEKIKFISSCPWVMFFLLHIHKCLARKYTTCKIHKNHPGAQWFILHNLTHEFINDVISVYFPVKHSCPYIINIHNFLKNMKLYMKESRSYLYATKIPEKKNHTVSHLVVWNPRDD